ncbi:MAG: metalloprotease [Flavipsychrobacter sp.]|nr:metalloprotease [Flavipsychrobacter sp.]
MLWKGRRTSGNVEDRRGMGGGGKILGGGIGAAVLGLIIYLLGGDPSAIMPQGDSAPQTQEEKAAEDEAAQFVSVVLADTEDVWNKLFSDMGKQYQEPAMVLFNGYVSSACGNASSATGPFYCPLDGKLYIDLSFYNDLKERFNAPGDFAMAYVVAHEVGHHVQNILGISDEVQRMRQQVSEAEGNRLSVKLELQADFFAGVWAHHAQRMKNILESGDMEEALNAANAIGDDRLQRESQGHVVPDAFTHGTSAQRMHWFKKGYDTGDLNQGDTFNAPDL